jgi:hypothetical protein
VIGFSGCSFSGVMRVLGSTIQKLFKSSITWLDHVGPLQHRISNY